MLHNCSRVKHIRISQLTSCPYTGLGSNPGDGMDVRKCIVLSRHGGILKSRRATSPLERLVEMDERWEAPDHSQSVRPQN
ncbi:hypothetical protein TNCV_5079621 [Trichonephila clavipes]|nr:hypothetical protein TNCV_5079621 [Trichonephila clavipes]